MRWSYKTVHYDLRKEGLLGNAFLDESEVEQSLNEYGKAGWELVSILETQEGLLAVFKQSIAIGRMTEVAEEAEEEPAAGDALRHPPPEPKVVAENFARQAGSTGRVVVAPVEDYEIVVEEAVQEKLAQEKSEDDIGAIRIE